MDPSENTIIAAAMLAGLGSLIVLGIIEVAIGFPGQWAFVIGFVVLVLFGAVFPQLYLIRTDTSVSRGSRLGVVTLVLLVLAAGFSNGVTGTELLVIWILAGISIGLIVIAEVREGYRRSV